MKAVILKEHGGLDKLEYVEDYPKPKISQNQVLIRVKACALNHLDLFTREGIPGLKLSFPHIPGSDVSGIIEEIGTEVDSKWKIGDRIVINPGMWCGNCEFCRSGEESLCTSFHLIGEHIPGGYAEFLNVPAKNLLKIPDNISFEDAAGAALSLLTAYRMVIKRGRLAKNESVLVIGASGGVSIFAIQLAKIFKATVYATTSTVEKENKLKKLGVDETFNYSDNPDWWKSVYVKTNKRGIDLVVDSVGESTWEKSLKTLRKGGRLVTCGATTGHKGNTNINLVFWKQLEIIGSTMANQKEFIESLSFLFKGEVTVPKTVFPLKEALRAQEYMMNKEHFGKIVLKIE